MKQVVPGNLMALGARLGFGEPMVALPVESRVSVDGVTRRVERRVAAGVATIAVDVDAATTPADAEALFLTERAWGFGHRGETHMVHPPWEVHAVRRHEVQVDWAALYGPAWAFLEGATPASVIHARGSAVRFHGPLPILQT